MKEIINKVSNQIKKEKNMEIKNILNKSKKIVMLLGAEFLVLQDKINSVASAAGGNAVNSNYHIVANKCSKIDFFITTILFTFLMLVLWFVSPVGILFFLSSKILFSKKSSEVKRKIAWVIQGVAFLVWISLMTVLLIVYLDSISYNILGAGSAILDFAITSGFMFLLIMLAVCTMEKKAIMNNESENSRKGNDNGGKEKASDKKGNSKRNKKMNNDVKIAGAKTGGGIKAKVRRKIKEDLKEIVNDEIEKRL